MKIKIKKILNNYNNWTPPKILIYILLTLFILFLSLQKFNLDNDFWFLINTGKYIINNGIPLIEPFTIHSNLSITVQQWLTDVIFYTIYHQFNIYGMFAFVTIIYLFSVLLIYKLSILISNNKIKISFFSTIIISALLGIFFITTRPQIFDCLLILLELYLLEAYIHKNNKLYLIGLPLISLAMINLHASIWLMLFVILIPYYIDRIIKIKRYQQDKYSLKALIVATIGMIIISFINPYGINAITYLFNSYGVNIINKNVNEMAAVTITNFSGIVTYLLVFVILYSYYYNKESKPKLRYFLLFLGTTYLGLSHYKGILFLIITTILPISYNFQNLTKESTNSKLFYQSKKMNIFIISIFIIYLTIYGIAIHNFNFQEKNTNYLNNIANYLDDNANKNDKIYTNYNDGGYLEYRGYKCYIDPRAEVFLKANNKKEDIFEEYISLSIGKIHYKKFLDKYQFDYLVVSEFELLYNYIQIDDGYEIVYEETNKNNRKYRLFKRIHHE